MKDPSGREYSGARGARFAVFPGSGLFKQPPSWVMVAELVETTRLWGRVAARIDPADVEPLAGHLVKRTYSEPRWDARRGSVVATERVTLYGLPIVTDRTVQYGRIDPVLSRELFIRRALVEGDWQTRHAFVGENRALVEEVEALEHRARRRDILADDQARFEFFDARVPADVVSAARLRPLVARRAAREPGPPDVHARRAGALAPTRSTSRHGRRRGARATSRSTSTTASSPGPTTTA